MSTPVLILKGRETFVADLLDFLKRQAVDHLPPPTKAHQLIEKIILENFERAKALANARIWLIPACAHATRGDIALAIARQRGKPAPSIPTAALVNLRGTSNTSAPGGHKEGPANWRFE